MCAIGLATPDATAIAADAASPMDTESVRTSAHTSSSDMTSERIGDTRKSTNKIQ